MELILTIILWIVAAAFIASTAVLVALIIKYDRLHRDERKRTDELTNKLIAKIKSLRENGEAKDDSDGGRD